jgi:hypothetical protein
MPRRLFTLLSTLSLLLCVGTSALWLRSCRWFDWYTWNYAGGQLCLSSQSGGILLFNWRQSARQEPTGYWSLYVHPYHSGRKMGDRFLGFAAYVPASFWNGTGDRFYEIPWWFVVFGTGVAPILSLARTVLDRRQRKRTASGRCPKCGYDLRATPDRCPECGTAPGPKKEISN